MIKLRDLYTQYDAPQSIVPTGADSSLGQVVTQYEVRSYTDVRNLQQAKGFILTCTQRLIFPNPSTYNPTPTTIESYLNYPAILTNGLSIAEDSAAQFQTVMVLEYSPRTLNTSVSASQSTGTSSNTTLTQQYTSGSSTSQTNSYGTSSSVGVFGDAPTANFGIDQNQSTTSEQSTSTSTGNAIDNGNQLTNSSSMALKDWGSYGTVDASNQILSWVWGQEYPWNIVQFNDVDVNGNSVLPSFVQLRLWDGATLYPPSELSLFGVNFVCKVSWLLLPKVLQANGYQLQINHQLVYGAASHSVPSAQGSTYIGPTASVNIQQPVTWQSTSMDLDLLSLDPILMKGGDSAVIGFLGNQFDVPPDAGAPFAITSEATNLIVRGTGFNGITTTDFTAGTVELTIYFKLIDSSHDIGLTFKHWTLPGKPVQLSITVNGVNAASRFVDAPETGSGGDNVLTVALRRKNFTSVDYCDYLQMGLNVVTITVTPVTPSSGSTYQLLAMAVG